MARSLNAIHQKKQLLMAWYVLRRHGQALLRADLYAAAALDALHALDLPGAAGTINSNRVGRALSHAHPAEDALVFVDIDVATGACFPVLRDDGLVSSDLGGRFFEHALEHDFTDLECCHLPSPTFLCS